MEEEEEKTAAGFCAFKSVEHLNKLYFTQDDRLLHADW